MLLHQISEGSELAFVDTISWGFLLVLLVFHFVTILHIESRKAEEIN